MVDVQQKKTFGLTEEEANHYTGWCERIANFFVDLAENIREDDPVRGAVNLAMVMTSGADLLSQLRTLLVSRVFPEIAPDDEAEAVG